MVAALLGWVASVAQTYLSAWVGQRVLADLRRDLFAHIQTLELGYFERNRAGWLISRLTNDVDALEQLVTDGLYSTRPEHPAPVRHGGRPALPRLAARARDAHRVPADGARDDALPRLLGARLPAHARAARRRHRDARRGPRRARASCSRSGASAATPRRFGEISDGYRGANYRTVPAQRLVLPVRRPARLGLDGDRARLRRLLYFDDAITIGTLFAFMLFLANFFDPVQALSQLYNTFLAASAALDKIFDVMDTRARAARRRRRADARRRSTGAVELRRRALPLRRAAPRCCTASTSRRRRARPSRSSGTPAPASRRSSSCSRASTTPPPGAIRIDGHDLRDVAGALAAQPARHRAAGGLPVRRARSATTSPSAGPTPRFEDVRAAARAVGADDVHRGAARGLRHVRRRARRGALDRPAPADRVRPRAARRPAPADPRRGHLERRHRERGA